MEYWSDGVTYVIGKIPILQYSTIPLLLARLTNIHSVIPLNYLRIMVHGERYVPSDS